MAWKTEARLAGLILMLSGCSNGPGNVSNSGLGSTSGQAPDGGPSSCDHLLETSVTPKVFVLPPDAGFARCGRGTSDGLGNLAFAVQTGGHDIDPPGDARLNFLDSATGLFRATEVVAGVRGTWDVVPHGVENGFIGEFSFLDLPPSDVPGYQLTWFDHTGHPTGARQESGSNPGAFQSALFDGRVFTLTGDLASPTRQTLLAYGADGQQRWATELPPSMLSTTHVLGVDLEGRTLVELPSEGGGPLLWVDESGDLGVPFELATGSGSFLSGVFPRVEGGFFLLQRSLDYPYTPHWAGQLASGETTPEPAPDWLRLPSAVSPPNWFRALPGRDGYAFVVDPATLEVRSVDGEVCGHVSLVPVDGRIRNLDIGELGADGTLVLTGLSCGNSAMLSTAQLESAGVPVCRCAWQYWPALLH